MDTDKTVAELLKANDDFAIIAHISPDGDAIGSVLALYNSLLRLNKKAGMFIDDVIPEKFSYLSGYGDINSQSLKDYKNAIVLDCGDTDRCGIYKQFVCHKDNKLCINIDHHISNNGYGTNSYIDSDASSVGEMLYEIITAMDVPIDKEISECIYTSIVSDTGGFKYSNTRPVTHLIAGELLKTGIDFSRIYSKIFDERSVIQTRLLSCVLNTLQLYFDNKVALMYVKRDMLSKCSASDEDADSFVNYARDISSVDVGILLKEKEQGIYKVSLRSKSFTDVRRIAEAFSGGGHIRAAGCTIKAPLNEATEMLLSEIKKVWTA